MGIMEKVTDKTFEILSGRGVVTPEEYQRVFLSVAKRMGVEYKEEYTGEIDARVGAASEMLSAAIYGANEVSASAEKAKSAIENEDKITLIEQAAHMRKVNEEMEELRRRLYNDELTEVKNRVWVADHLIKDGVIIDDITIAFIDMNGFKNINDSFGHETGDQALVLAAKELSGAVVDLDGAEVVRYGGDEFVICCAGGVKVSQVDAALDALREKLSKRPVGVRGTDEVFYIDFSYGTASAKAGESISEVIKKSDEAMYKHKLESRGQHRNSSSPNKITP